VTQSPASTPKLLAPAARRLALLWLVVAMLFQGLVTQTHVHLSADPANVVISSTRAVGPAVDAQKDGPVVPVCLLCEEQALFGAYLLGAPPAIVAPIADVFHYTTRSLPSLAFAAASHAWRSRAPPIFTL
jgi:hypothetical protein